MGELEGSIIDPINNEEIGNRLTSNDVWYCLSIHTLCQFNFMRGEDRYIVL